MSGTTTRQQSLSGIRVVAFESRMAQEMTGLIVEQGGLPLVAPAMAEVPLAENVKALEFAEKLLAGRMQLVIFLTGAGTRRLIDVLATRYDLESIRQALTRTTVVARGPKPLAVLRTLGVSVAVTIPGPSTWRELLETLDSSERCPPLQGLAVALQEYGAPNQELIDGLKSRGAELERVPVYRWTLPDDTGPLGRALDAILEEDCQTALFTNAVQVWHLFQFAEERKATAGLKNALSKMIVGSIGPNCSAALRERQVSVDVEPARATMALLVEEVSRRFQDALKTKRERSLDARSISSHQVELASPEPALPAPDKLQDSAFLRACRRLPASYTPVWLMRQAGRYMAEYREIRARYSFLELCKNSDLAAEVTITAAHRLGVDAAIIFADILLIVEPLGLGLRFEKGDGPAIDNMVRSASDVARLRVVEPEDSLGFVFDAVRKTRAGLRADIPLIGFAGAPFTLASYMVEGGASKSYRHTKALMHDQPQAWHAMMDRICEALIRYLNGQVAAGAQAVQLFDSWVGCLSPQDYREYVMPYTRRVIEGVAPGVPVINFSTGTSGYLEIVAQAGGDVIGVDWRVELDEAWRRVGDRFAIQGNLDPLILFSQPSIIREAARKLLSKVAGRKGHIFNLGHGILPETPVENVLALVEAVHEFSSSRNAPGP
ncbi:MAG: uroporphyrinogen decarboxylase [Acidobacteriota bacterium]